MKKIPALFIREERGNPKDQTGYMPELNRACLWVFEPGVRATRKWDGTAVLVQDGMPWARFDAKRGQVRENVSNSGNKEAWDVLQEDEWGSNVANMVHDSRPDPSLVFRPLLVACKRPRLAGESCSEDIDEAAPGASVKGKNIGPDCDSWPSSFEHRLTELVLLDK